MKDLKFAVLFPGQGSQKVGMGADLHEASETAKEIFNKANKILDRDISNIFLNGPIEELNQTKNTQPAIVTISAALTLILSQELKKQNLDFSPYATCGHSLGEFTALWFANLLTTEELIKLVSIRGSLMQNSKNGGMAAILNLSEEKIKNMIESNEEFKNKIVIANYNSPNQFVVSGEKEAVNKLSDVIKLEQGKAIILPVSGAFHSPLMEEASNAFNAELDKLYLSSKSTARLPIYQNYDGKSSTDINKIKDKIKKQMTSPVYWTQIVNNLVNDGVRAVIEIGPGKVLTGLVKKINPSTDCYNIYDLQTLKEFISNYEHKFLSNQSQKITKSTT